MEAVRQVIASNGVSYLRMASAGSHSTSEREKEGTQEKIVKPTMNQFQQGDQYDLNGIYVAV